MTPGSALTPLPPTPDQSTPLPVVDPALLPDTSLLVTEDGLPVDNIYSEKQQRLLTEPLYSSWRSPDEQPFLALANVGLFFAAAQPPLVPDVMLSLDVPPVETRRAQDHRSYFTWVVGKVPEVVVEIVSDRRGGEDGTKMRTYARLGIIYYVIYDPQEHLRQGVLRVFGLDRRRYKLVESGLMTEVGLGVVLWGGNYEGDTDEWLRWCDLEGNLIPTGRERAEQERQRANDEKQRANDEKSRADAAEAKTRLLMERLRQLGETVE